MHQLENLEQHFSLPNTEAVIREWLASYPLPRRFRMGCESTAGYHLKLARVCVEAGHPFVVINPILTKQFIRATVRKQKTDRNDAMIIAKLLAQGNGQPFHPAATIARRFDPQFRVYYEKKRLEGKKFTVAGVATARKMVAVVYAILQRKTPFVPALA